MRIRNLLAAIGVMATAVLAFGGSASAATTVGNACAAKSAAPGYFLASLTGDPTNPFPNAIPSAGVITSWTIDDALGSLPSGSTVQQKLKVFRRTPVANQLYVVGESALSTLNLGVNTFPTRISVQPGDLIGSTGIGSFGSETIPLVIYCEDTKAGDLIAAGMGDPPPGSLGGITEEVEKLAVPITVQVEPDADGDGYGDETQDK